MLKKLTLLATLTVLGVASSTTLAQGRVGMRQGRFFRFATPAGWRVVEEGQAAVVLMAPDNSAITMMVGNAGLPQGYNPAQYVHEKLALLQVHNLQVGQARQVQPSPGCVAAYEFEFAYSGNGVACRGVATCSIRAGYDTCDMAMTAAASDARQWGSYASWLPQVASNVEALNGNAFGARGIMQQNLDNSVAFGKQLEDHRESSHRTQRELADARWQSDVERNHHRGEGLTGQTWQDDPFGNPPQRQSSAPAVYWINRDGRVAESDNPTFDPRTPTDADWQRMTPQGPGR